MKVKVMKMFISLGSDKPITIYRLEHGQTKLGPFEHGGQIAEVVNRGIDASKKFISDIDELTEVKAILKKYPHAVFGFTTSEQAKKFIKDQSVLDKHGFKLSEYKAVPLFVAQDGQVIFKRD